MNAQTAISPVPLPAQVPNFKYLSKWGGTLILMPIILLLDQPMFGDYNITGQMVGSIMGWIYWAWMYAHVPKRLSRFMFVGLIVALFGEWLLAIVLGMYEYRFQNIPFYVPPGHVGAFVVAYLFVREPWVLKNRKKVDAVFYLITLAYAVTWATLYPDVYGFALYILYSLVIFYSRGSRTFFLSIFLVTTYMELVGTYLGCWHWYPTLMNRFPLLTGANPPSGITFLYLFFDMGCLAFYLLSNLPLRARYDGYKAYKRRKYKLGRSPVPVVAGNEPG